MPSHDSPSDHEIVAGVLAGDFARFEEIVTRYQGALLRVSIGRLGNRNWAEDAVQETFLRAYKSLATYRSEYSFRTWLWTILLNQCSRIAQKRGKFPTSNFWQDDPGAEMEPGASWLNGSQDPAPLVELLRKERAEILDGLLNELPVAQSDALRLRFFGGLKFQEIADTMHCSLSSAKQRVRHGLMRLSEKLTENSSTREAFDLHEDVDP